MLADRLRHAARVGSRAALVMQLLLAIWFADAAIHEVNAFCDDNTLSMVLDRMSQLRPALFKSPFVVCYLFLFVTGTLAILVALWKHGWQRARAQRSALKDAAPSTNATT